jgi:hypothetical protein
MGGFVFVILYLPWVFLGIPGALAFLPSAPAAQISSISVHWFSFPTALNWFNNGKTSGIHSPSPWWHTPLVFFSLRYRPSAAGRGLPKIACIGTPRSGAAIQFCS